MSRTLTGYNFLITTPNELILFPTSLKYCLVYFKIYFKKIRQLFGTIFETIYWFKNIFLIGFWREEKAFKCFGVHPAFPHIEGKHSEPWHNILHALFDTIMTPHQYIGLVILCGDVIICMNAYWKFPCCLKWTCF